MLGIDLPIEGAGIVVEALAAGVALYIVKLFLNHIKDTRASEAEFRKTDSEARHLETERTRECIDRSTTALALTRECVDRNTTAITSAIETCRQNQQQRKVAPV
jgi:hypothetical protein